MNEKPCVKCGGSERNKRGDCMICARANHKAWYQKNKPRVAEAKRTWLANNPEKANELDLIVRLRRYGLTIDQYRSMFTEQKGRCRICGRDLDRIDIDHDHATGRVRGLLCHPCNIGLGAFQDSPLLLARAIEYLKPAVEELGVSCIIT